MRGTPPQLDEIEISLLGTGSSYGESVLVHVGNNNWFIVDSCEDPKSNLNLSLEYLREIKVDFSQSVKMIIATHWHVDHVKGISNIFSECKDAIFVLSDALKGDEFTKLVKLEPYRMLESSALGEITKVMEHKKKFNRTIKYAKVDNLLWEDEVNNIQVCLKGLSPSDETINYANLRLAKELKNYLHLNRSFTTNNRNYYSVVLSVEIGNEHILLGADLENHTNSNMGWSGVLKSIYSKKVNASVFKIPHHGSDTGYNPTVWKNLLIEKPIGILTPYSNSNLPLERDVKNIYQHADKAFITSSPNSTKKKKRTNKKVEKLINDFGLDITNRAFHFGHIRLRKKIDNSNWNIEKFGNALPLIECYIPLDN